MPCKLIQNLICWTVNLIYIPYYTYCPNYRQRLIVILLMWLAINLPTTKDSRLYRDTLTLFVIVGKQNGESAGGLARLEQQLGRYW